MRWLRELKKFRKDNILGLRNSFFCLRGYSYPCYQILINSLTDLATEDIVFTLGRKHTKRDVENK